MRIHDVQEYVQLPVFHPPFIIEHLLARGGTMLLYGKAGVMKSWLSQHQGFCIATGTEWLGLHTTQARVLLVNFEISEWSYHHRLSLMNQHFALEPQLLFQGSPSTLFLEDRQVFTRFKEDVDSINPEVIVMDCISGCFGGDENSSKDIALFLLHMRELMGDGRSLILVHHSNKNLLAVDPMDKARGHTKLTGWVDTIVHLVNQPTGKQVQFGKTRHAPLEMHPMNVEFVDYLWQVR